MILRLSPRLTGRVMHVLIRSSDESQRALKNHGLLTFDVAQYRAFLSALRQGSTMTSPAFTLRVDDVQLGST